MSCLSFCSHLIPGGIGFVTEPFGPVTTTVSDLMSTFTFSGIGIGFLPIRDIASFSLKFRVVSFESTTQNALLKTPNKCCKATHRQNLVYELVFPSSRHVKSSGY